MADNGELVYSILAFLDKAKQSTDPDTQESIEVGGQCIESAFNVSLLTDSSKYAVPWSLQEIFKAGLQHLHESGDPPGDAQTKVADASPADKEAAEKFKSEGNEMMKQEKYKEAIDFYSSAIEKDGNNAVYYCNRAAAKSRLSQHQGALDDCVAALHIDPTYSKAFGRKGLAHSALNQHQEATECYKKALELDPENQSYRQNLDIAEQKLRESGAAGAPGGLNLGGMDFTSMLQNPELMNMAASMMNSPQMQTLMTNLIQGGGGQGGGGGQEMGINSLLQAGQQFAQTIQQQNPELVEQLRSQMQSPNEPNNENGEDRGDQEN